MNDTSGSQPRTDRTANALRAAIAAGRFAGGVLPGERELAPMLGVSRTTLRRAIAILVAHGELTHRSGFGTAIVTKRSIVDGVLSASGRDRILGPGDDLMFTGEASGFKDQTSGIFRSMFAEAQSLSLPTGALVCRRVRTWLDPEGRAVALERCSAALTRVQSLPPAGTDWLDHLADCGTPVIRAKRIVRVEVLGAEAQPLAGLIGETTGIIIEQHGFSLAGDCVMAWRLARRLVGFEAVFDLPSKRADTTA